MLAQAVCALVDQLLKIHVFSFKHLDYLRVKGFSRFIHQPRHRFLQRQSAPILPIRSQSVQKIHCRQNAGANRNLRPAQSQRIACPVKLFVMGPYDGHDRVWKAHPLEDFRSHQRMNLHFLEFFRRQAARFRDDVLGNRKLAYIVQQGCGLQRLHPLPVNLQFLRHLDGVNSNSLQVVVSRLILGLDGESQRFDGAHMQVGHFFHMPLLICQFAEVKAVGAIDEVHHGKRQQRCLPVGKPMQPAHHSGYARAHQVVREAPEVAVCPDLS